MKRRSNRTPVSTSQLDLPFAQPGTAHDLAYYIGLCNLFAAYHKRWPTSGSTREEFRSARVPDYDGQRLERELRFPSPELEADPAYQALRDRCLADGESDGNGVGIAALEPRYRDHLPALDVAELLDTATLPGAAGPGTVRYATGLPAHAQDELTLRVGDALRARALARAGLDPDHARVRAGAFALRVRATDALKSFMERIGMIPLPANERLADHYLLVADDAGRLIIHYQLLVGTRYAGRFDADQLAARLAAVYAGSSELARLRDA